MAGHRRRRRRHVEDVRPARPPVTDTDLLALWPKYGREGQRLLTVLQQARDGNRTQNFRPHPEERSPTT